MIMNVSLTPKLEGYVKQKLSSGFYNSASEIIREGLRLLEEQDSIKQLKFQQFKEELNRGITSLDAGHARAFNKDNIKAKGRLAQDNN